MLAHEEKFKEVESEIIAHSLSKLKKGLFDLMESLIELDLTMNRIRFKDKKANIESMTELDLAREKKDGSGYFYYSRQNQLKDKEVEIFLRKSSLLIF